MLGRGAGTGERVKVKGRYCEEVKSHVIKGLTELSVGKQSVVCSRGRCCCIVIRE